MNLRPLPLSAGWIHAGARTGYEVLFTGHDAVRDAETAAEHDAQHDAGRRTLRGTTAARDDAGAWAVEYDIALDEAWGTTSVRATGSTAAGLTHRHLERLPDGTWLVDGAPRADLAGCVDVDFESSAVTNTLPIHRLAFTEGSALDVPAAFVEATGLRVTRIEQRHTLRSRASGALVFDYESPTFDFRCTLTYDASGLILDYPGIARRDH